MNQKALKVLEYDKIIQLLAEQATSDAGKKRCLELVPMTDKQLITDAQAQTADALSRIYRKGNISFGRLLHHSSSPSEKLFFCRLFSGIQYFEFTYSLFTQFFFYDSGRRAYCGPADIRNLKSRRVYLVPDVQAGDHRHTFLPCSADQKQF